MSDFTAITRPSWVWLIPLVGISFFWGLGEIPLFDLDEGAFSAATWEMLQRRDFITTYLNGELRFDKPILIYWLQALSVSAFGLKEWAFRLPSALAASFWMIAIYRFLQHRIDARNALLGALLAACSAGVVVIGRAATADALLNLFLALAMLDIYRHFEQPSRSLRVRVFLWMALAVLTKGPVGIVIPLVVSVLFYAYEHRLRDWWRALAYWPAWLLFLAVVAPWYLLEYQAQGQAFIDGFFLKHNVGRFSATMEGHGGSLFYYFGAIFLVLLPFSGALLYSVKRFPVWWRSSPLHRFLLFWFAWVFLLFSFSSTQLPHYILYGCTPLFILWALDRGWLRWRVALLSIPLAFAVLMVFFPEVLQQQLSVARNDYIQAVLTRALALTEGVFRVASLGLLVVVLSGVFLLKRYGRLWVAGLGLAYVIFLTQWLLPLLGQVQQAPVKQAALQARALGESPIVMYGLNMPSFTVYQQAIVARRQPQPGELVFTRVDKLPGLGAHELLFSEGGIVLARKAAER